MKLTLDHTQRLNLHALLGAQRADVGSIRAIWAVQDKLALDADEEKALELIRPSPSLKGVSVSRRRGRPDQGRNRDVGRLRRSCRSPLARTID